MNFLLNTTKIANILALRMLGLFMLLPILSPYLKNITLDPWLIGLAVGIYGLTQSIFQIPFGYASDRLGRKKIIALGLIIFALGSLICALSSNIYWIIFGRALQGAGAIGSSAIAFLSDLTSEEQRAKAMAIVGISIGLSFSLAIMVGPLLNIFFSVSQIFYFSALCAMIALMILFSLPTPLALEKKLPTHFFAACKIALSQKKLLYCYGSIFLLHAFLTNLFILLPILSPLSHTHQSYLYFALLVCAILILIPLLTLEKKYPKPIFLLALVLLLISQAIFIFLPLNMVTSALVLLLFLAGFNFLEAYLPSLTSQFSLVQQKGTSLGIFSSCQFLGIFFGGLLSGIELAHLDLTTIFLIHTLITCFWVIITAKIELPIRKHI